MKWTDDRVVELQSLQDLLNDISGLNRGNHFIEKLQSCITVAEQLTRGDIRTPRESFIGFLQNLCIEERGK